MQRALLLRGGLWRFGQQWEQCGPPRWKCLGNQLRGRCRLVFGEEVTIRKREWEQGTTWASRSVKGRVVAPAPDTLCGPGGGCGWREVGCDPASVP